MIAVDPIDTLVELFPRLFRGQRPGSFSSLPEGWLKLASQLFDDLDRMLDGNNAPLFEVRQIKEKLCRLRVHFWLGPPFTAEDETAHRVWSPDHAHDRVKPVSGAWASERSRPRFRSPEWDRRFCRQ